MSTIVRNILLQLLDYCIDALVIGSIIGAVYLVGIAWGQYAKMQYSEVIPAVVSTEVQYKGEEAWRSIDLPLTETPKPAAEFLVRIKVSVPSMEYTVFNFRQEYIDGLQVNGVKVEDDFPFHGEDAYMPDLQQYMHTGMNEFIVEVRDGGAMANFDIRPVPLMFRNAVYKLPSGTGGWVPFSMPLALNKKDADNTQLVVKFDVILPPLHSGVLLFNQDRLEKLVINNETVKAPYPVDGYNIFRPDLSKYLHIPGNNSVEAHIQDNGDQFNFIIESISDTPPKVILLSKFIALILLLMYGTWRLRQMW